MGMYTEICISGALKPSAPGDVRTMARHIFTGWHDGKVCPPAPSHEFFECQRWEMLFGSSYYFEAEPSVTWRDDRDFSGRGNVKDYDGEIGAFLDWISPHVEPGFGGFLRYEEDDAPTLVWFSGAGVVVQPVVLPEGVQP